MKFIQYYKSFILQFLKWLITDHHNKYDNSENVLKYCRNYQNVTQRHKVSKCFFEKRCQQTCLTQGCLQHSVCEREIGSRWQGRRRTLTISCESIKITTAEQPLTGRHWNPPKKITHIQRQRSPNETVGGAQLL